jgi:hypothetical protein
MAYQNVGTPRFYVDDIGFSKTIGLFEDVTNYSILADEVEKNAHKIVDGNPSNPFTYNLAVNSRINYTFKHINYTTDTTKAQRFYAILGHNFNSGEFGFRHHWMDATYPESGSDNGVPANVEALINGDIGNVQWYGADSHSPTLLADYDGFSIATFRDGGSDAFYGTSRLQFFSPQEATTGTNQIHIGNVFLGSFYDMPHSPDLSLKLSYEYDGVKNIQTKGGATLSNASYTKPADWGKGGAWQLGVDENQNPIDNFRSGRRVWDLSFSFLSSNDLSPANAIIHQDYSSVYDKSQMMNVFGYDADDIAADGAFNSNILTGTDFFSQVWNKTMGGHLPFIFQPNKDVKLADSFAICRFDMDSLQYEQVAHNTYNVKLKIRESW